MLNYYQIVKMMKVQENNKYLVIIKRIAIKTVKIIIVSNKNLILSVILMYSIVLWTRNKTNSLIKMNRVFKNNLCLNIQLLIYSKIKFLIKNQMKIFLERSRIIVTISLIIIIITIFLILIKTKIKILITMNKKDLTYFLMMY